MPGRDQHRIYNELGDPSPVWTGWLTAVAALGLSAVALSQTSDALVGLRYARLQRDFGAALTAPGDLGGIVDDRKFAPLLDFHRDIFRGVRPLFPMVENGQISAASNLLELGRIPAHPLIAKMSVQLRALAQEQEGSVQYATAASPREPFARRYSELRDGTADALLMPRQLDGPQDITFYSSGILKDLPVLSAIPDGISSYEVLASFSPKFAGHYRTSAAAIRTALSGLRQDSLTLAEERTLQNDEVRRKEEAANATAAKESETQKKADHLIRDVLFELATLSLPDRVVRRYESARAFLTFFCVDAPPLRSSTGLPPSGVSS